MSTVDEHGMSAAAWRSLIQHIGLEKTVSTTNFKTKIENEQKLENWALGGLAGPASDSVRKVLHNGGLKPQFGPF